MIEYEASIGLEVHIQLKTKTKMFCSCRNIYGSQPNTEVCPICLGMPGVLPMANRQAISYALKLAIAAESKINKASAFCRKNYFYPDLPKGYQISQYHMPLAAGGELMAKDSSGEEKTIRLKDIHLEEEAGKLVHDPDNNVSMVDFNRCGIPLIELVTEPEIKNGQEAYTFLYGVKRLVEYLDICTGNMEEGAIRCDVNVSVRDKRRSDIGTRREIKNLNSFKFAEKAINYEINQQIDTLKSGNGISQETLTWDEKENVTKIIRTKEESEDYRYFAEPDLPPLSLTSQLLDEIKADMPELPDKKYRRFIDFYHIPARDVETLISKKELADYYEAVAQISGNPKLSANWLITELLHELKDKDISQLNLKAKDLADLIKMVSSGKISYKTARDIFPKLIHDGKTAAKLIEQNGLRQISDETKLKNIIAQILDYNKSMVKLYIEGKDEVFHYFVGQVMKETGGRANPEIVNRLLREALDRLRG
jgi:aspartyl-tRNA(Asn)/glutamyl-tRNA(Gln) amidotransferase subunit B